MTTPPTPPTPGSQPGFEQVIVPPAPQPAAAYPPAPSNVYAQPGSLPPAPSKSGNTVLKIVLIVIAVIVLLGVLAAAVVGYGVYRVSKAVHRASNGVSFSTPSGGTISTGDNTNITSAELGLPDYPGAKHAAGSMKMRTPAGSLITAAYTTTDPAEQVVSFYKDKMGEQASVMEGGGSTILSSNENRNDKLVVTITPQDNLTKITVLHTRR